MPLWPLHPRPWQGESLSSYVHRLAEAYGISLDLFCRDTIELRPHHLDYPPREALERLSAGTGIPLERLEDMQPERLWARLAEEARRFLATPEGKAAFERMQPRLPSQNS